MPELPSLRISDYHRQCLQKRKDAHVKSFPALLATVYTYRQIHIFDTSVLWTLSSNFNNTSWLQQ